MRGPLLKHRLLSKKIFAAASLVPLCFIFSFVINSDSRSFAAPITDFNAGNIIEDSIFYNKNAMTVQQIQTFLNVLIPNCDTWGTRPSGYGNLTNAQYAQQIKGWPGPPYTCLNQYHENPTTGETSYEKGGGAFEGGLSSAQIIYNAAQMYNINPQVLLVMLKKESLGPITADSWPLKSQYKYSMGYACPDSGPNYSANCDNSKAGFYKQIMLAAWQLNYYKEHSNDYRYKLGWNDIQYSTEPACGTKRVFIENMATLSLYIYTPYTPNNGALAAYPGTASCGAYGNRNFFMFFKEWFGTVSYNGRLVKGDAPDSGIYLIENDTKRAFPSEIAFISNGYSWSSVSTISSSELANMPYGAAVNYNANYRDGQLVTNDGNSIYLVVDGKKRSIASESIFLSYAWKWSYVRTISAQEFGYIPVGEPMPYNANYRDGQLVTNDGNSIYLVVDGKKRSIASESIFLSYAWKWSYVRTISAQEFGYIPVGEPMPYNN